MQCEGTVWQRVEKAVGHHRRRPLHDLFGRLEHEPYGAGDLGATRSEDLCGPQKHRDVRVVPAGVHLAVDFGSEPVVEWHRRLGHWQGVHVGAQ